MCDFCDNKNPFEEIGWLVSPNGKKRKKFCSMCGGDENSALYKFWEEHPDWKPEII